MTETFQKVLSIAVTTTEITGETAELIGSDETAIALITSTNEQLSQFFTDIQADVELYSGSIVDISSDVKNVTAILSHLSATYLELEIIENTTVPEEFEDSVENIKRVGEILGEMTTTCNVSNVSKAWLDAWLDAAWSGSGVGLGAYASLAATGAFTLYQAFN